MKRLSCWLAQFLSRFLGGTVALLYATSLNAVAGDATAMFAIYNFSGKTVIAPTIFDNAGSHGAFDQRIPNQDMWYLGGVAPIKGGRSVTVEWIAGEGRARWYQVTLPVKIEHETGTLLEIYLRPDRFVCASLVKDANASNRSENAALARVHQDRSQLSCARPVELPPLRAPMASGFEQDISVHSWQLHDRTGASTLTNQTLNHRSGPVQLRYENDYKDRPYYIKEFSSVQLIGSQSAWLVTANLRSAYPALFVVTGNRTQWQSRFLGSVWGEPRRLAKTRVLHGENIVVDAATADIFILPKFSGIYYHVLGQSPDGRHVAIYWQQERNAQQERSEIAFNFLMINLQTGEEVETSVPQLPALPPNQYIFEFYGDWYRSHCNWTPLLTCR